MATVIPFDLEALQELIARDGRVVALFLTGSHAEGRADEHSDVDLLAVAAEGDVAAVAAHLPSLVHEIEPLVDASTRSLGPTTLLNLVTERCLRIDIAVTNPGQVAAGPRYGGVRRLFDRGGVEATLPEPVGPFRSVQHDEPWFDSLVTRVLRTVALLPMVVGRDELIRGAQHVQLLKEDLLELLLFAEGDPPVTRPGSWAWSELDDRLSGTLRQQVMALPPAAMTRADVIEGHLAVLTFFLGVARQVARRAGFVWKHSAFEAAVNDHLARAGFTARRP